MWNRNRQNDNYNSSPMPRRREDNFPFQQQRWPRPTPSGPPRRDALLGNAPFRGHKNFQNSRFPQNFRNEDQDLNHNFDQHNRPRFQSRNYRQQDYDRYHPQRSSQDYRIAQNSDYNIPFIAEETTSTPAKRARCYRTRPDSSSSFEDIPNVSMLNFQPQNDNNTPRVWLAQENSEKFPEFDQFSTEPVFTSDEDVKSSLTDPVTIQSQIPQSIVDTVPSLQSDVSTPSFMNNPKVLSDIISVAKVLSDHSKPHNFPPCSATGKSIAIVPPLSNQGAEESPPLSNALSPISLKSDPVFSLAGNFSDKQKVWGGTSLLRQESFDLNDSNKPCTMSGLQDSGAVIESSSPCTTSGFQDSVVLPDKNSPCTTNTFQKPSGLQELSVLTESNKPYITSGFQDSSVTIERNSPCITSSFQKSSGLQESSVSSESNEPCITRGFQDSSVSIENKPCASSLFRDSSCQKNMGVLMETNKTCLISDFQNTSVQKESSVLIETNRPCISSGHHALSVRVETNMPLISSGCQDLSGLMATNRPCTTSGPDTLFGNNGPYKMSCSQNSSACLDPPTVLMKRHSPCVTRGSQDSGNLMGSYIPSSHQDSSIPMDTNQFSTTSSYQASSILMDNQPLSGHQASSIVMDNQPLSGHQAPSVLMDNRPVSGHLDQSIPMDTNQFSTTSSYQASSVLTENNRPAITSDTFGELMVSNSCATSYPSHYSNMVPTQSLVSGQQDQHNTVVNSSAYTTNCFSNYIYTRPLVTSYVADSNNFTEQQSMSVRRNNQQDSSNSAISSCSYLSNAISNAMDMKPHGIAGHSNLVNSMLNKPLEMSANQSSCNEALSDVSRSSCNFEETKNNLPDSEFVNSVISCSQPLYNMTFTSFQQSSVDTMSLKTSGSQNMLSLATGSQSSCSEVPNNFTQANNFDSCVTTNLQDSNLVNSITDGLRKFLDSKAFMSGDYCIPSNLLESLAPIKAQEQNLEETNDHSDELHSSKGICDVANQSEACEVTFPLRHDQETQTLPMETTCDETMTLSEQLETCEVKSEEEANLVLETVSSLMKSYLKFKLKDTPGNEIHDLVTAVFKGQKKETGVVLRKVLGENDALNRNNETNQGLKKEVADIPCTMKSTVLMPTSVPIYGQSNIVFAVPPSFPTTPVIYPPMQPPPPLPMLGHAFKIDPPQFYQMSMPPLPPMPPPQCAPPPPPPPSEKN